MNERCEATHGVFVRDRVQEVAGAPHPGGRVAEPSDAIRRTEKCLHLHLHVHLHLRRHLHIHFYLFIYMQFDIIIYIDICISIYIQRTFLCG